MKYINFITTLSHTCTISKYKVKILPQKQSIHFRTISHVFSDTIRTLSPPISDICWHTGNVGFQGGWFKSVNRTTLNSYFKRKAMSPPQSDNKVPNKIGPRIHLLFYPHSRIFYSRDILKINLKRTCPANLIHAFISQF